MRFDWRFPTIRLPAFTAPEAKYVPNEKGEEIIGLKNAKMIWQTLTGVDNNVDDAGASGLRLSIFNTASRADSAHIRLLNSSGSSKTIRGCVIRGKPVIRYSGDQGYVHDSLINYDDILENGEKKFEFGNNYVCEATQLSKLSDAHWKNQKTKRHVYQVMLSGHRHSYSPGEWLTLRILVGGELVDSVCECCDVQIEGNLGDVGQTVLILREVYQNWVFNINALPRFIGQGSIHKIFSYNKIKVASSTYTKAADIYCDGVADQVEINKAINDLAGMGGGTLELTEGTFYISDAIAPATNIAIVGQGWNTVIEKNCNTPGIYLTGSDGNEYTNIYLANFKITRNAADTNGRRLINLSYCDNLNIQNLWVHNSVQDGILLYCCDHFIVSDCRLTDSGLYQIYAYTPLAKSSIRGRIIGNDLSGGANAGICISNGAYITVAANIVSGHGGYGIFLNVSGYCSVQGNICAGNSSGLYIDNNSDDNTVAGNTFQNNTVYGIRINNANCDRNVVTGNRATGNGTNFSDAGTNTTNSGNDFV